MAIKRQGLKKIWTPAGPLGEQLTHFACPGHFLVNDLVGGWLDCTFVHWASDLWKLFAQEENLQYLSWTTPRDFFQALQGNNLIFGKFCIWPFTLLLCLEYHHRYRNLCNFFSCKKKAWKKNNKQTKKTQACTRIFSGFPFATAKVGPNCDDLLSFNSSPHSSYISYILFIVSFV